MIKSNQENYLIFFFFIFLCFSLAIHKNIFIQDWSSNFDMDIIIVSNSLSILNNKFQSFFDHPGFTTIFLFSLYLKILDFFNVLSFNLVDINQSSFLLNNISELIFHARIFNLISIAFLLQTFFLLFQNILKNKLLSFLITLALFFSYDFLSYNFFPVRTEIFSLLFLNLMFIFIFYRISYKIFFLLFGIFLSLALFSKIQVVLLIFVYLLIFSKIDKSIFFHIKKSKFFKLNIILNTIFSILLYYSFRNTLDALIYFFLLNSLSIFFYNFNKSIKFEDYIFVFFGFSFLLIFIKFFSYNINNINTVFTPLTSSLRWVQEKYLLFNLFNDGVKNSIFNIELYKNLKNYLIIISYLIVLFFLKFTSIKQKKYYYIIFISIFILWTIFSMRSGFLRYGIYILPIFYLLFAKILTLQNFDKKKFFLIFLILINLIVNFSFVSHKYNAGDNTRITKDLCRNKENLNSKTLINYYFSINSNSELNKFCTIFTKLYN